MSGAPRSRGATSRPFCKPPACQGIVHKSQIFGAGGSRDCNLHDLIQRALVMLEHVLVVFLKHLQLLIREALCCCSLLFLDAYAAGSPMLRSPRRTGRLVQRSFLERPQLSLVLCFCQDTPVLLHMEKNRSV